MSPRGDVLADGARRRPRTPSAPRLDRNVSASPDSPASSACGETCPGERQARVNVVEPAGEPTLVAVDGAAAEPCLPGPPIPRHHPVVERQSDRRQPLVVERDRRQAFQHVPEVVAEEPGQPAEEARRIRPGQRRRIEPGEEAPGDRERVGTGRRGVEDGHRVGGQVRPAGVPARTGALEQDETRQVAERFRDVDRWAVRHARRAAAAIGSRTTAGWAGSVRRGSRRG